MTPPASVPKADPSTRDRILEAALELFLTKGDGDVTMRQIAAAVGLSPMAIYRHFEDKADLQLAILNSGYRLFASYLDRPSTGTALDALRAMAGGFTDFAVDKSSYFELIFLSGRTMNGLKNRDSVQAVAQPTFDMLVERVAACQQAGELPGDDPKAVAADILAAAVGHAALHISGLFARTPTAAKRAMRLALTRHIDLTAGSRADTAGA